MIRWWWNYGLSLRSNAPQTTWQNPVATFFNRSNMTKLKLEYNYCKIFPFQVCLFNVTADPCEKNNLVFSFPDVVSVKGYLPFFLTWKHWWWTLIGSWELSLRPTIFTFISRSLTFKVRVLEQTLEMYRETAVPPANTPVDPRADPKFFNYTW